VSLIGTPTSNIVRGYRLFYGAADDSEHVRDFKTFAEARAAVRRNMKDWVIFELVEPGRYATAGRVLASKRARRR
jgi:hypothetical protein